MYLTILLNNLYAKTRTIEEVEFRATECGRFARTSVDSFLGLGTKDSYR